MIQSVNKLTGEVYEFAADTAEEMIASWSTINETIKALERAKDQLKPLVENIVNYKGVYEGDNYRFRISSVQRFNYDKAVMRQVFDEDLLDTLLEPHKPSIDAYIKENLEDLGESSTLLRESMIEVGKAYQVIKLEKL
jgi:hypothetical protein